MISAFGVDHGEDVAKLFNNRPHVTGHSYTVYEVNRNKTIVHRPNGMMVHRDGKTLFLRRPKYVFETGPMKVAAHKGSEYYGARSPKIKPDKDTRRKIHALAQSKKGTVSGKVNGMQVRVSDKK